MKKLMKWAAGVVAAAGLAAGFAPLSLWPDLLRSELEEQIVRTTALEAQAGGDVRVALLPFPTVIYRNVRIGHPDGTVSIVAERLTADLSVSRLLVGRIEFDSVHLVRPQVVIDGDGSRPERARAIRRAIDAPTASEESKRADRARLGGVRIVKGSVRVRAHQGMAFVIDDVDATIDWPSLGAAATVSGRAAWRGERFDIDALLGKPGEVLRGERSPFTMKLNSRLLDVSVDGSIAGGARWLLEGRVATGSKRFPQFLSLLDAHPPIPGRLSRLALSGQLRAMPNSATLSDLRLTIDGNAFDGSLTLLAGAKRPKLSGTLATRAYELKTRDAGLPAARRERQWSRDGIAIGRLDMFDADLRVSASQVTLGRLVLSDAGFVIALDDGKLEITTADAEAYGGALRGRWAFDSRSAVPELAATASFKNINIAQFLRGLGHANSATGFATGDFILNTRGSSVHAMMQNAAGKARAAFRAPEIVGVDLERALRRSERRPLSIPGEVRNGQTTFVSAEVEATITDGVVNLDRAIATGHGVDLGAAGVIGLAERTLRVEIAARQPRAVRPPDGREPPSLIMDLTGSWDDPSLSIDPESLIRRSQAAEPLWRRTPAAQPAAAPLER